jgi:hypothetical protein
MEKNKKIIKIDILDKFRELQGEEDAALPGTWLRQDYFRRLNTHEKKIFDQAVAELASSGLIEYTPGVAPELRLTQKGENLIF